MDSTEPGAGLVPLVVAGASAGGVEALTAFAEGLPAHLPAAVLVVLHVPPTSEGNMAAILSRRGPVPASIAKDGEAIEPGRIYLAASDHHMLIRDGHIELTRGPRENYHRPAIDPLFRSAAVARGPGVVGILLSGARDDGVAGLGEIKKAGGIAICQDPDEALFPSMPRHAMNAVAVDHVAPAAEIGPLVAAIVRALPRAQSRSDRSAVLETTMATNDASATEVLPPGEPSGFGCPECGGALWQVEDDNVLRFRCRTGHAYSSDNLLDGQRRAVEDAFWIAIRALQESADLYGRLADRSLERRLELSAADFRKQAQQCRRQAQVLREAMVDLMPSLVLEA